MNQAAWDTIAIVGVGLIGGSIGLAVRQRAVARHVIGIGRDTARLQVAQQLGTVDQVTTDLAEGVARAELVVVCAPVDMIAGIAEESLRHAQPGAIVTDAGSTKRAIEEDLASRLSRWPADCAARFVGSHPLAGSEKTGAANADGDLFRGRTVVVTTNSAVADGEHQRAVRRLRGFWTALEANVIEMTAEEHDVALAMTSHLPHCIAAVLAASTPADYLSLIGTGWLDTTRVAGGDVELWRQILMQNRQSVLQWMEQFAKVLASFQRALQQHDDVAVADILSQGKQRRDAMAD